MDSLRIGLVYTRKHPDQYIDEYIVIVKLSEEEVRYTILDDNEPVVCRCARGDFHTKMNAHGYTMSFGNLDKL